LWFVAIIKILDKAKFGGRNYNPKFSINNKNSFDFFDVHEVYINHKQLSLLHQIHLYLGVTGENERVTTVSDARICVSIYGVIIYFQNV
jgi:hypothetical protein